MLLEKYEALLVDAVIEAGQAIMEIYADPSRFNVELKGDESPLTAADQAANDIICKALASTDIPIISEENKQAAFEERRGYKSCWLVDPLDGTKEFIKRNGEFTVNIALVEQGQSILGIIYVPVTGATYLAARGEGSYLMAKGKKESIRSRTFDPRDKGLAVVCSRSHLNSKTEDYLSQYADYDLMPRGSSLKFTELAQGMADFYPRIGPTMEWDTAAAQIILEEAGGAVLDFESREPLRYNKENLLNPNFIALGTGSVL
ncbi:MAG: 3'(2'),5'-bisphosphate nucleotidase CysQ [Saprospiraceae bacterium]|nr:3'(2'),5'-bisphosphate nucleotidase CysQ [Saprospiraceae bacterium]